MEHRKKQDLNTLIKIAKENRNSLFSKEISEDLSGATKFCLSLNIKEGCNKVFEGIIYQAYITCTAHPLNKKDFFNDFATLIPREQTAEEKKYYQLNYKPAQLLNVSSKRRVKTND